MFKLLSLYSDAVPEVFSSFVLNVYGSAKQRG